MADLEQDDIMITDLSDDDAHSLYETTDVPSPIALSIDSNASDDEDENSDDEMASSSQSPVISALQYLNISSTRESLTPAVGEVRLENPYLQPTIDIAWRNLNDAPDMSLVLKEYIAAIEPPNGTYYLPNEYHDHDETPDQPRLVLDVALMDESVRRLVVERYAEGLAQQQILVMADKPHAFEPLRQELRDLFARTPDTYANGQTISTAIANKIDYYSWTVPSVGTPFRTRKEALLALHELGLAVLAAPAQTSQGILASRIVSFKLGLALKKLIAEATPRDRGSLKRFGVTQQIRELVTLWTAQQPLGEINWEEVLI